MIKLLKLLTKNGRMQLLQEKIDIAYNQASDMTQSSGFRQKRTQDYWRMVMDYRSIYGEGYVPRELAKYGVKNGR